MIVMGNLLLSLVIEYFSTTVFNKMWNHERKEQPKLIIEQKETVDKKDLEKADTEETAAKTSEWMTQKSSNGW